MPISRRVRNVWSRCRSSASQRRPKGVPEDNSSKPVVIFAYPQGVDDSSLKERLSSLLNQQALNPDFDPRAIVDAKDEYIDIRPLKEFAKSHLSPSSSLYDVIFAEPDQLELSAFHAKVGIWLRLIRRGAG